MGDASETDWAAYYAQLSGRAPRPLFQRFRSIYLTDGTARTAVDLGCGDGTESLAMLADGLSVTAIDGSAASVQQVSERAASNNALTAVQARLEDLHVPTADLIYSSLTLPFCHPDKFPSLWERLLGSLLPDGLIAVDLFGDRHGWSAEQDMTFVTSDQVNGLISNLEVLDLREVDEIRPTAVGGDMVRMHTFDVIARTRQ